MAIVRKDIKVRTNVSLHSATKEQAAKYAKERYNTSLSGLITAMLEDFIAKEKNKKVAHIDQGSLI